MNDYNFIRSGFIIQVDIDKEVNDFNIKYQKSLYKV